MGEKLWLALDRWPKNHSSVVGQISEINSLSLQEVLSCLSEGAYCLRFFDKAVAVLDLVSLLLIADG